MASSHCIVVNKFLQSYSIDYTAYTECFKLVAPHGILARWMVWAEQIRIVESQIPSIQHQIFK